MLVARLPPPWRGVRGLNHGLCSASASSAGSAPASRRRLVNPSPVLRLPLTWLYGPIAFCFALMALRYLQVLRRGPWAIDADRETNVG